MHIYKLQPNAPLLFTPRIGKAEYSQGPGHVTTIGKETTAIWGLPWMMPEHKGSTSGWIHT